MPHPKTQNPNTFLDKSCSCSVAECVFFMIEKDRGWYISNYVCLGCQGSKLFYVLLSITTLLGTKISRIEMIRISFYLLWSLLIWWHMCLLVNQRTDHLFYRSFHFRAWTDLLVKLHTTFLCPCRVYQQILRNLHDSCYYFQLGSKPINNS